MTSTAALRPPTGTLVVTDDVAATFAETVVDALEHRPSEVFSLALSGGPTAMRCYERLREVSVPAPAPRSLPGSLPGSPRVLDWSRVDVYFSDERCVDPSEEASNLRAAREALLDHVGQLHSVNPMYTGGDVTRAAELYHELVAGIRRFDLVHLGLGPDGHTASLFAGSPALEEPGDRLCMPSSDPSGRNPYTRLTLTLPALSRAAIAVFTVSGVEKRAAFSALCSGEDLPAARVRARRTVWIVDSDALGSFG